jgi:hypothetical protein
VYRKHRSCAKQVMALTTHNEIGFQRRLKTGVVFVDLSCVEVLRTCARISNQLKNMLSNHFFQVFLRNLKSRWRRLNKTAPILFNLYKSDSPSSSLIADEITLTHQERTFEECIILRRFFHQWRLRPNPSKTEHITWEHMMPIKS